MKKQNVISLDMLHNIPYDITETSYRIFSDFVNRTRFENDSFVIEYIKKLKHFPAYFLPSVNVSLHKMLNIGWNLIW